MRADPQVSSLVSTPKPLIPLAGRPLLDHWLEHICSLRSPSVIVVVSNNLHHHLYLKWAEAARKAYSHAQITIVDDGSQDNDSRLGAVKDIEIGLKHLEQTDAQNALIIAGDTLIPDIQLPSAVDKFDSDDIQAATFAYPLLDMFDCKRRGMFRTEKSSTGTMLATALVEKPATPEQAPSNLASAPVYMLKRQAWDTVTDFCEAHRNEPLEKCDAPGFWLSWLIPRTGVRLFSVDSRIDIGGLPHYKDALCQLVERAGRHVLPRLTGEPAIGRAYPRMGLLGNPSDGYGGKVIGVALASEGCAEVIASACEKFCIVPNPSHELKQEFDGLSSFLTHVETRGLYYSARTLIAAASLIFARAYRDYCGKEQGEGGLDGLQNCRLSYSTTIPARIGLSGSSAFILATLRALARFHDTSLEEICPDDHVWPELMRSAEADLMGISCGLMDRVVQVMQGCIWMDFTKDQWTWGRLDEGKLPQMYLCYMEGGRVGECSGNVHGGLKERHEKGDADVVEAVKGLCEIVDRGREMLESENVDGFAGLVDRNFELRVSLVGETGVGKTNLKLVRSAQDAGFAAKMTGSGGCALCIPNPVRELSETEESNARQELRKHGIILRKAKVLKARPWQPLRKAEGCL